MEEAAFKDDEEFLGELEKVGSERGKLRRKLEEENPELSRLFGEQTEAQKAWGRLVGKIIMARSNDDVERAFDWWAVEYNQGVALGNVERITAFFHALASLGCSDGKYRILRRMYIQAATNE